MLDNLIQELGTRGIGVLLGLILGSLITGLIAYWRRIRERRRILLGDARDTVVIHQHLIDSAEVTDGAGRARAPTTMRIRCVGQGQVRYVVPNGHLASVLLHRARAVTSRDWR